MDILVTSGITNWMKSVASIILKLENTSNPQSYMQSQGGKLVGITVPDDETYSLL